MGRYHQVPRPVRIDSPILELAHLGRTFSRCSANEPELKIVVAKSSCVGFDCKLSAASVTRRELLIAQPHK